MKLLRELLDLSEHIAETENKIKVELPKPRNKQGNDILRSKRGGRHFDKRKDYDRAKEKQKQIRTDD